MAPSVSQSIQFNPDELVDILPVYYKMIFPSDLFYSWLSYGSQEKYFDFREFSFTLPGDTYIRYRSFTSASELTASLVKLVPIKLDIGAVFSSDPKYVKKALENTIRPIERELVFDIDMTDYDELRTCCQGASVCKKCWKFMAVAAKILDHRLRRDFGFKHILWVYSGRRGIHCWVCDERARKLSNDARGAIVSYLSIIEGGAMKKKRVNLTGKSAALHPMIHESVSIITPYFEQIIEEQNALKSNEDVISFIKLYGNTNVQNMLNFSGKKVDYWSKNSAIQKYDEMSRVAAAHFKTPSSANDIGKFYDEEIKLQYCYPRLDVNVSKGMNHLLKAPFCVHPKTGRICIPFDVTDVDAFDPSQVPTIKQILLEIDEFDKNFSSTDAETLSKSPIDKTSLKSSIQLFSRFISNLKADRIAAAKKTSAKTLDF